MVEALSDFPALRGSYGTQVANPPLADVKTFASSKTSTSSFPASRKLSPRRRFLASYGN